MTVVLRASQSQVLSVVALSVGVDIDVGATGVLISLPVGCEVLFKYLEDISGNYVDDVCSKCYESFGSDLESVLTFL